MTLLGAHRVAIVWRGDEDAPDALQPESGRLKAIFAALNRAGMRPEPAPYDERHAGAFTQRLRGMDAALVWVNPVDKGRNRKALDAILRLQAFTSAPIPMWSRRWG
jgi:hypothetical protein